MQTFGYKIVEKSREEIEPVVETEVSGMNRVDSYTLKWDYFEAMAELRDHFPASRKVFEVKPWYALDNMALTMARLG